MANEARIVYVAIGDSLTSCLGVDGPATQCYPAVLAHDLPSGGHLLDLGLEGETAEGALSGVPSHRPRQHPTILVGRRLVQLANEIEQSPIDAALGVSANVS
jgi:hypothetical protein